MTREQAIEKIKKLQALKEGASKISSDGEAGQAAKAIDRLQKEFGITMEEVYTYSSVNEDTNQSSDTAPDYTEEQRQVNIDKVEEALWMKYNEIINEFRKIKDSSVRIRKTLDQFDILGGELVNNERLMKKCARFNIDIGGMILDMRREMEIHMYDVLEDDRKELEKHYAEQRARREQRQKTVNVKAKDIRQGQKSLEEKKPKKTLKLFGFSMGGLVLIALWALAVHAPKQNPVQEHHDVYQEVKSGERSYDDLNEDEKRKYSAEKVAEKVATKADAKAFGKLNKEFFGK